MDDDDAYEDGYQDGREGFGRSPFHEYTGALLASYHSGYDAGAEDRRRLRKAELRTGVA